MHEAYHYRAILTGEVGKANFTEHHFTNFPVQTELEELRLINKWNSEGRGAWQYWLS